MNPPLNNWLLRLRARLDGPQWLFVGFVGLLLLGGAAAALARQPALLLPALLAVGALLALLEWRWVYYAVFAVLPFSQEISLFGGLSMDVPSEPLMLCSRPAWGWRCCCARARCRVASGPTRCSSFWP